MADFSCDRFATLLAAIRHAGYRFERLDRISDAGRRGQTFLLRFDVDISPASALRLGRIGHAQGVVATFLFQLNAETYNAFARSTLAIVQELRALGHAVGLHVDQAILGEDEARIAQTLDWFSSCITEVDPVISFHRPSPTVLGRRYARLVNAYEPRLFAPERYLSDSRRSLAFWPRLESWLAEGRTPIQLLLHPEWWNPHENAHAILRDLRARRGHELDRYLDENFHKVFAEVLEPAGACPDF